MMILLQAMDPSVKSPMIQFLATFPFSSANCPPFLLLFQDRFVKVVMKKDFPIYYSQQFRLFPEKSLLYRLMREREIFNYFYDLSLSKNLKYLSVPFLACCDTE